MSSNGANRSPARGSMPQGKPGNKNFDHNNNRNNKNKQGVKRDRSSSFGPPGSMSFVPRLFIHHRPLLALLSLGLFLIRLIPIDILSIISLFGVIFWVLQCGVR